MNHDDRNVSITIDGSLELHIHLVGRKLATSASNRAFLRRSEIL